MPEDLKRLLDGYSMDQLSESFGGSKRRRILSEIEEKAKALSKKTPPIPDEEIAEIIREDRERK